MIWCDLYGYGAIHKQPHDSRIKDYILRASCPISHFNATVTLMDHEDALNASG